MPGLGTTGQGVGSAGSMPGGGQINPQMLAALMQQQGVGTPFAPQGQSPMSQFIAHAQPPGGGMPMQHPQIPQQQGPQNFTQALGQFSGQPGQAGQSPLAALLGQLTQGQGGVQQPGASQQIPPQLLEQLRSMSASPVQGASGFNVGGT